MLHLVSLWAPCLRPARPKTFIVEESRGLGLRYCQREYGRDRPAPIASRVLVGQQHIGQGLKKNDAVPLLPMPVDWYASTPNKCADSQWQSMGSWKGGPASCRSNSLRAVHQVEVTANIFNLNCTHTRSCTLAERYGKVNMQGIGSYIRVATKLHKSIQCLTLSATELFSNTRDGRRGPDVDWPTGFMVYLPTPKDRPPSPAARGPQRRRNWAYPFRQKHKKRRRYSQGAMTSPPSGLQKVHIGSCGMCACMHVLHAYENNNIKHIQ